MHLCLIYLLNLSKIEETCRTFQLIYSLFLFILQNSSFTNVIIFLYYYFSTIPKKAMTMRISVAWGPIAYLGKLATADRVTKYVSGHSEFILAGTT